MYFFSFKSFQTAFPKRIVYLDILKITNTLIAALVKRKLEHGIA